MSLSRVRLLCLSTLVAMSLTVSAFAASSATLMGRITDPGGAVVPGAKVTATNMDTDVASETESNQVGLYIISNLLPGRYRVVIQRQGFETIIKPDVVLHVEDQIALNFSMQVGSILQSVTVQGGAPLVDTTTATMSGLVDDRRVVDLPLNGRNVISLAGIIPGVLNVTAPQQLLSTIDGPTMDVNGGRPNMNYFTFDGAYFSNPQRNTGINYPPPDAIQEFRILTDNFTAEYGDNPGSETIVVSRAGSNDFHGDVWEFLRNDAFDARNFFASSVPTLRQNQFGGAVGGPIKKDHLFFFGSYQGLRVRPQAVPVEALVPSALERSGDFTGLGTTLTDPVDPLTGKAFTDSSGNSCVANNIVNPNCISPVATTLLNYVPQSATGAVTTLAGSPSGGDMYFGRLDWNQSSKNTISGHGFVDHNTNTSPFGASGNIAGYEGQGIGTETDMATVNFAHTFSPTLLNQAVVSFLRTSYNIAGTRTEAPTGLGITMPQYAPTGTLDFDVAGYFDLGSGYTTRINDNNYQFRDVLVWMKGRHTFKFGGEFDRHHSRSVFIGSPQFIIDGTRSGNAISDLLLGVYDSLNLEFGITDNNRFINKPNAFFQDDFKVTPRFMLNFGVRYEPFLTWISTINHINTVIYGQQSTVVPDAPLGIVFPGDAGVPRGLSPKDLNNFAPRVGFAWDLSGDGKTSLRGGYGVFYETINADSLSQQNAPWSGYTSVYTGLIADPFNSAGQTAPPAAPTGSFGCTPTAAAPGITCPLFPLPIAGVFTDRSLRSPYIQSWNLNLQHQITQNLMVEAAYVGKIGTKIEALRTYDPAQFIPDTTFDAATGLETTNSTPGNVNNRVIYEPLILSPEGYMLGNDFRSWYHSFQASLTRRLSHGLSVNASYTLAKSIDSSSTDNLGAAVSDPFNLRTERGRSDWDRRHAFVASYLWSPPYTFSQRWKRTVLGGWTFAGITTLASGPPITFYTGPDVALDGTASGLEHAFLTGSYAGIPESHPNRGAMINEYFDTNAFVNPVCGFTPEAGNPQAIEQQNCTPFGIKYSMIGKYGQSGRGILSGPGLSNTDFSFLKDFAFKERYAFQLRFEFFNIFNQVNFNNPDSTVTDGSFGQILGASPGRILQVAGKFKW